MVCTSTASRTQANKFKSCQRGVKPFNRPEQQTLQFDNYGQNKLSSPFSAMKCVSLPQDPKKPQPRNQSDMKSVHFYKNGHAGVSSPLLAVKSISPQKRRAAVLLAPLKADTSEKSHTMGANILHSHKETILHNSFDKIQKERENDGHSKNESIEISIAAAVDKRRRVNELIQTFDLEIEFNGGASESCVAENRKRAELVHGERRQKNAHDGSSVIETKVPLNCEITERSAMKICDALVVKSGSCLDMIVKSMYNFPGTDAPMHEWVCSSLARWAEDSNYRAVIIKNKGIDVLMRAMKRYPNNASVQMQVFQALGNLFHDRISRVTSECLQDLISAILEGMKSCNVVADVHAKGCYALSTLLSDTIDWNSTALEHACDIIIHGMKRHYQNSEAQGCGCTALWYLASVGDVTIPCFRNVLHTIVDVSMYEHRKDTSVQMWSLEVITKWQVSAEHIDLTTEAKAMVAIGDAMIMHSSDAKIVELFCTLLLNIAHSSEKANKLHDVISLGIAKILVNSLWEHRDNHHVQESICAIISHLARSETTADKVVLAKGLSAVVSAMTANTRKRSLQRHACRCLLQFAEHAHLHEKIGNSGCIYALLDAMCFHPRDEDIQVYVSSALSKLSVSRCNAEMLYHAHAQPLLERAMRSFPESCLANVKAIFSEMVGKKLIVQEKLPLSFHSNCSNPLSRLWFGGRKNHSMDLDSKRPKIFRRRSLPTIHPDVCHDISREDSEEVSSKLLEEIGEEIMDKRFLLRHSKCLSTGLIEESR